jgi:hypothetical protein
MDWGRPRAKEKALESGEERRLERAFAFEPTPSGDDGAQAGVLGAQLLFDAL